MLLCFASGSENQKAYSHGTLGLEKANPGDHGWTPTMHSYFSNLGHPLTGGLNCSIIIPFGLELGLKVPQNYTSRDSGTRKGMLSG